MHEHADRLRYSGVEPASLELWELEIELAWQRSGMLTEHVAYAGLTEAKKRFVRLLIAESISTGDVSYRSPNPEHLVDCGCADCVLEEGELTRLALAFCRSGAAKALEATAGTADYDEPAVLITQGGGGRCSRSSRTRRQHQPSPLELLRGHVALAGWRGAAVSAAPVRLPDKTTTGNLSRLNGG